MSSQYFIYYSFLLLIIFLPFLWLLLGGIVILFSIKDVGSVVCDTSGCCCFYFFQIWGQEFWGFVCFCIVGVALILEF